MLAEQKSLKKRIDNKFQNLWSIPRTSLRAFCNIFVVYNLHLMVYILIQLHRAAAMGHGVNEAVTINQRLMITQSQVRLNVYFLLKVIIKSYTHRNIMTISVQQLNNIKEFKNIFLISFYCNYSP